ncbi:hypothetical protein BKA63DRAFT_585621 [Paraphoma chrysanthemicola]|nr:hypothetical protein BKA63DRAFT_585621 [Paraphoma chrysanthemicola]
MRSATQAGTSSSKDHIPGTGAEHDLEVLIWHWKSEEPGKRVGTFKSRDTRDDCDPEFQDDPFTRVCLSSELRHEMPTILSGCPTLIFDGDDPEDCDTREFSCSIRAVEACEFFLSKTTIGDLGHKLKIIIETNGITGAELTTLTKLSGLLQLYPQVRVVELGLGLGQKTVKRSDLRLFGKELTYKRERLENRGFSIDVRTWRIHMAEEAHLHIEALREILSETEFNNAKDFIENGI